MSAPKKVTVARTSAGLGLVSNCEFKKGDLVIEYTGELISNDEADARANRYLFEINDTWTLDGASRSNLARYINHSCRPNCEAEVDEAKKRIFIYARKKIKKDEELSYDYGKDHFNEFIKPKGCKCEKCQEALRKRLPAILKHEK